MLELALWYFDGKPLLQSGGAGGGIMCVELALFRSVFLRGRVLRFRGKYPTPLLPAPDSKQFLPLTFPYLPPSPCNRSKIGIARLA